MNRRAAAIVLIGLGICLAGHDPASAGAKHHAYSADSAATSADETLAYAGQGRCWWDVPVINAGVAFFQLLRDDEPVTRCPDFPDHRSDGRSYDQRDR